MARIFLLQDGSNYSVHDTEANTVGDLLESLGTSDAAVSVNQSNANSDTPIREGDTVAIVARNKKGG